MREIGKVLLPFIFILGALGLIWLLLTWHLVLLAQIVLVLCIVVGAFLWLAVL